MNRVTSPAMIASVGSKEALLIASLITGTATFRIRTAVNINPIAHSAKLAMPSPRKKDYKNRFIKQRGAKQRTNLKTPPTQPLFCRQNNGTILKLMIPFPSRLKVIICIQRAFMIAINTQQKTLSHHRIEMKHTKD